MSAEEYLYRQITHTNSAGSLNDYKSEREVFEVKSIMGYPWKCLINVLTVELWLAAGEGRRNSQKYVVVVLDIVF